MPDARLIKRYANRKLYDTVERRFTTLDELEVLVSGGTPILVKDHESGTDRTEEVLAQVLGVRAKAKKAAKSTGSASSKQLTDLLRHPTDNPLVDLADALSGRVVGGTAKRVAPSSSGPSREDLAKDIKKVRKQNDRLEEEVVELRDQVSQLVEAVTVLLRERAAELEDD